ncbi:MAG: hypothetical protein WCG48_01610 [Candidatus Berkelbacteria bacterium]
MNSKASRKILLISEIPPCSNYSGGLILAQLCRFLPKSSLACFLLQLPIIKIRAEIPEDLAWIPTERYTSYFGFWPRVPYCLNQLIGRIGFYYNEYIGDKFLLNRMAEFAKKNHVDSIWCILSGQATIRLATKAARKLGLPLYTEVWDPPIWEAKHARMNELSTNEYLKQFEDAIRESKGCATASWAMAQEYEHKYGARTVPLIPSLDQNMALPVVPGLKTDGSFIIGMAGQIYAKEEWVALVRALESVEWKIAGRKVSIKFIGKWPAELADNPNISVLGWRTQEETIKLLSQMDVLYCPYWFDSSYESVSRYSFPSKITTYLAAGRPVLFHGPDFSSPARFIKESDCGLCCNTLDSKKIICKLTKFVVDEKAYAEMVCNGRESFNRFFTNDTLEENFKRFLELN